MPLTNNVCRIEYTKCPFILLNAIPFVNSFATFSHQEKLVLEGEKYLQSKEGLRLMLTELKKQQEAGFALQPGLPEKQAQLKICKKFLQKAQDLTSLLEELKSQGNYLLECTKNPSFSEEPWLEVKRLHESLLQQLQVRETGRGSPCGRGCALTVPATAKFCRTSAWMLSFC